MEVIEFVLFLFLQIFLILLTIMRKGVIFSTIGIVTTLFVMATTFNNFIIQRTYVYNGATAQETLVYADPTLTLLLYGILIIMHTFSIIRGLNYV
jgi:hypothetical protein